MLDFKQTIVFSAIQPSGKLTIANYIGALMHWSAIQKVNKCFYCIADLHCLTVNKNIFSLKESVLDTLAMYLACGVNPKKSIVFVQSHVYEHCQLQWLLSCFTYFGELSRMTQFKKKSINYCNNAGLFNYPILMASDILLYQSDKVPIGIDQIQHLELTRNIAKRLNALYGDLFKVPTPIIFKQGGKIFSLQNPTKKMSKSDPNKDNSIFLLEKVDTLKKKIQKSKTDSDNPPTIFYDYKNKPGISNLLNIFSILTNTKISVLEKDFVGVKYSDFKNLLANVISNKLSYLQKSYFMYRKDETYLYSIAREGADKARLIAQSTFKKIQEVIKFF
ncbi:tryptophanyl-tRNA synthetase [Buchnera aphidicola (Nipponaphis monzeni)]|uniref:Tryptophan--tRNA ligase n=1 Tax=Buchnera aphidicola (Nipponaphis monzeni) TaxID=2495405 RepID=A0A455TAN7_9GAMM|nr:tryptophan--tRNA ligase [Buchnera aphidicola]BBI01411.1 tryptophanyl-tRNA synthetase [Buchnera aphidicola (Nipponaphis monzeni)]